MRISQETPDTLVIEKRTSVGYFIGIMLALVGVLLLLVSIISFTIQFDKELIVPAVLILIGFIIVAFNKQISLTFDKKANRISYIEERLIGTYSEDRQLNQTKAVELREMSTKKNKIMHVIALVFKDKPEIEIQPAKLSFSFLFLTLSSIKNTEEIANRISGFLGLRLVKKTSGPAEVVEAPVKTEAVEAAKEAKETQEEKEKEKIEEKPAKLSEEEKTEL
jgi:hypothetical protein